MQNEKVLEDLTSTSNNSGSTVIDRCNRACDCLKSLLNSHHHCQYLDVSTTFTNFNFLPQLFLKQYLPYFEIGNQIYNGDTAKAIRNMEIFSNNPSLRNLQRKTHVLTSLTAKI